jgi:predicted GNAT superfamily acetyltransferase
MTSGLPCIIEKGAILVAFSDSVPVIGAVTCIPEDADAFQRTHVPEEIRNDTRFAGISFVLRKQQIEAHLKII